MKKRILLGQVLIVALLLSACQSSNIQIGGKAAEKEASTQAGSELSGAEAENGPDAQRIIENPQQETTAKTTKHETQAYVIPEGATGPGDVTLAEDAYADYPEDKKPVKHDNQIQVRYFYVNSKGLNEEFDVIEAEECTADNLNELMITMGVLVDDTEVVKFESDGTNGTLTLNKLEGESSHATAELLAQAIASTFTDNLGLDTITVKVGDKTYGPLEYSEE